MCLIIGFNILQLQRWESTNLSGKSADETRQARQGKTRGKPRSKLCCKSSVVTSLVQFLISLISLIPLCLYYRLLPRPSGRHVWCYPFPGRRGTGKFLCTWIEKRSNNFSRTENLLVKYLRRSRGITIYIGRVFGPFLLFFCFTCYLEVYLFQLVRAYSINVNLLYIYVHVWYIK